MKQLLKRKYLLLGAICLAAVVALSSCSAGYVLKAGVKQADILLRREAIEDILAKPSPEDAEEQKIREKLQYVLDARAFAEQIGLTPEGSYQYYTEIDGKYVLWVLMGSQKDAFELETWWYPIVGRVPYKGFFEKEDAEELEKEMLQKGLDTRLRGAEAYSTLGWFDDPILSSTLRAPIADLVNTVIHEIFHSTYWIPGSVDFNETAANFVGCQGAIEFFEAREHQELRDEAENILEFERYFAGFLQTLHSDLTTLYAGTEPSASKIAQRKEIFERHMTPVRERYPRMTILSEVNNAEIMQLVVYRKNFSQFEELFLACESKWGCFFDVMLDIQKRSSSKAGSRPFELLSSIIAEKQSANE